MSKTRPILLCLFLGFLFCVCFVATSSNAHPQVPPGPPNNAPKRLQDLNHSGASLAPFTRWKPANKGGKAYFLLGREAGGANPGTYDAFGGARDPGENHPLQTAAREGAEETINLLGNKTQLQRHINSTGKNTKNVVVSQRKRFAVFVTEFNHKSIDRVTGQFYRARKRATVSKYREKDSLALVRWDLLQKTIANAPRDAVGRLITPIRVNAEVIGANGRKVRRQIHLRPIFASTMQDYFKPGKPGCRRGLDPKVQFCR